jgi:hypothetical protein
LTIVLLFGPENSFHHPQVDAEMKVMATIASRRSVRLVLTKNDDHQKFRGIWWRHMSFALKQNLEHSIAPRGHVTFSAWWRNVCKSRIIKLL